MYRRVAAEAPAVGAAAAQVGVVEEASAAVEVAAVAPAEVRVVVVVPPAAVSPVAAVERVVAGVDQEEQETRVAERDDPGLRWAAVDPALFRACQPTRLA